MSEHQHSGISEDRVQNLITKALKEPIQKLDAADASIKAEGDKTAKKLESISATLESIYGNGSGKKGILDRVVEEQVLEKEKQQNFRHDMRNKLEAINLNIATMKTADEVKDKEKANEKEWVKYVLGGLGLIIWKLITIFLINPHVGKH